MAAVEITISGVLYDKLNRTTQQVVLVGDASLTGLGIGGGPMPPGQGGGGSPPSIWDPAFPTPPIANVPGVPGYRPPDGGNGGGGGGGGGAPPTGGWNWAWSPGQGWHIAYVPGDKPRPPPIGGGGDGGAGGGGGGDTDNLPPYPAHPDEGIPHPTPQT